ncbi:electron transfer flavoprotein [Peptostreptococcaceae bacterium oral taxon 113 str. W5053]|nr:electron transfer flavoprotein [Peptostreptococcaceae bacterium oral taxon 113 str. W5053]
MHIIVFMKPVPTEINLPYSPRGTLLRDSSSWNVNPEDACALEAALLLKDTNKNVKVTIITMSYQKGKALLYEGLAKGADHAIFIYDPLFSESDTRATAQILSKVLSGLNYDLIFCGYRSADAGTSSLPFRISEGLNLPILSNVTDLSCNQKNIYAISHVNYGYVETETTLPCVVSFHKDANHPRLPNMRLLSSAYDYPVETFTDKDLKLDITDMGWSGSALHVEEIFSPVLTKKGYIIDDTEKDAVDRLYAQLKQDHIL